MAGAFMSLTVLEMAWRKEQQKWAHLVRIVNTSLNISISQGSMEHSRVIEMIMRSIDSPAVCHQGG